MSDNTERIRIAARESVLEQMRPYAGALVTVFLCMFAVATFLATRASASDVDRAAARLERLEARSAFDDQRYSLLMEQMREIALATRARLVLPLQYPSPPPLLELK